MKYLRFGILSMALLLSAHSMVAGTIGPDAFGYTASNAAYGFIDITGSGTRILVASDDDTQSGVPLGFNFSFYGQSYTETCVGANGLVAFNGCEPGNPPVNFATTATFNDTPVIAPLNADWQFFNGAGDSTPDAVYYATTGAPGSRQFIVQWNQAYSYPNSPKSVTFELILNESSNLIQFEYLNVDSGDGNAFGGVAAIGIRDTGGDQNGNALMWSFSGSTPITGESAVQFSSTPASTSTPEPGTMFGMVTGLMVLGLARLKLK